MKNLLLLAIWVFCARIAFAGIPPQKIRNVYDFSVFSTQEKRSSLTGYSLSQHTLWAPIGNNIISGGQSICRNTEPAALTGTVPTGGNGSFTFQWQVSHTSASAGFSNITDATSQGYAPGALSQTSWYKRIATSGTETNTSDAVKITVDPMPEVTISYDQTPYCGTGTATVTLTGLNGGTFSSSSGLAINASTGAVNLSASTPGSYTVNYTFSSGACTSTVTANIDVGDPTLVITNPLPVCGSPTADLTDSAITAGSTTGLTFHYFSDKAGTMPVSDPEKISVSDTFYIRGISAGGCSTALTPVVVVLDDQPVITTPGTIVACKGRPVTLKASSPGNKILWQNGGTGDSIVVHPAGNSVYKAIAINDAGCTDTAIVTVQIQDFSVSLKANPNPMLVGAPVTLTTSANSAYEVIGWKPDKYFSNQTANIQSFIINDTTSTYYVIARSANGCIDTASVKTEVDNKDFFIPNAFTPNNDGRNDQFKVYGSSVTAAEIKIFNQWGAMIFETKDNEKGWDGTYKNMPQPIGLYIYVIKVRLSNDDSFIKKGTVRLIR